MTSQKDQIQSLIADIEQVLGNSEPRKLWIKASEVEPQRRTLAKVQDYLESLQQVFDTPSTGPGASQEASLASTLLSGESAENLLQALLTEMSFLKSSALEPLRREMDSLRKSRDSLQQEVQELTEQRQALAEQNRAELAAALEANRQASERQEALVRQEASLRQELSARREEIARQEAIASQELMARREALAQQEASLRQELDARREALAQQEVTTKEDLNTRQEMLARREATFRQELNTRQEELDQQEARLRQELSARQEEIARQEAATRQELSTQQAALERREATLEEEMSARQAALDQQEASLREELNTRQAEIAQREAATQQELSTQQAALERREATLEEEMSARQAALDQQEATQLEELDARQAEIAQQAAATQQELSNQQAALDQQEASLREELDARQAEIAQREAATQQELSDQQAALERREATLEEEMSARQAEIAQRAAAAQQELSDQQAALERREATLEEEMSARQATLEEEMSARQAALDRQEASLREELDARQAEIAQQAVATQQELSDQQAVLEQREATLEEEMSARQAALDQQEAAQREELNTRQAEIAQREAATQQELSTQQAALEQREASLREELDARQEALEQREASLEAELNARLAEVTQQEAATRQKLSAQQAALEQREASLREELDARQEALEQREAGLEAELNARLVEVTQQEAATRQELNAQQAALEQREASLREELDARQAALEQQEAGLEAELNARLAEVTQQEAATRQELSAQQAALEQREASLREELDARQAALDQQLDQQEALTQQELNLREELNARQAALDQRETAIEAELNAQRAALNQREATLEAEVSARQAALDQREATLREELDARQAALEQREAAAQQETSLREELETRQAALEQREASLEAELNARQAEIAQQEAATQQALSAQQAALEQQEASLRAELSVHREALDQWEANLRQEETARQAALDQQAARFSEEVSARREALDQWEASLKREDAARREAFAQREANLRQELDLRQEALTRQELNAQQEASAMIAEQQLNQFLRTLMARLQEGLSAQVTHTLEERLLAEANEQVEGLRQRQSQSDQLLMNIDATLQRMFETLQNNIDSYQAASSDEGENIDGIDRQEEATARSLVDHLTEQLDQAASLAPVSSPSEPSETPPAEVPETVTSLDEILPESPDDEAPEEDTVIALSPPEIQQLRPEDCIREDGTIDLDLLQLDIDRSDDEAGLSLSDLTVEPMIAEAPTAINPPSSPEDLAGEEQTTDATYLERLTLDDLTLDASSSELDLANNSELSDDADLDLDSEDQPALLEQSAPDIPSSLDSQSDEAVELAAVLPDFGAPPEAAEPAENQEAEDMMAEQPDEPVESAVVPDIPDANDDDSDLRGQEDELPESLAAELEANSQAAERTALAEDGREPDMLASDLEEPVVFEAVVPPPEILSQVTDPLESALIPDQPAATLEDDLDGEGAAAEDDLQLGVEIELTDTPQSGINIELADTPDRQHEFEQEIEPQSGLEIQLESSPDELEIGLERLLANPLEEGPEAEPQDQLEVEPVEALEAQAESETELEGEFEAIAHAPDERARRESGLALEGQLALEAELDLVSEAEQSRIESENALEAESDQLFLDLSGDESDSAVDDRPAEPLEDELEAELDSPLESELGSGLEAELESPFESDRQPETELDSLLAPDYTPGTESARPLETERERGSETLSERSPLDSWFEAPLHEEAGPGESLSEAVDNDWTALEEMLSEPAGRLESDLLDSPSVVETMPPHPADFDDDLDFFSAVSSDADLSESLFASAAGAVEWEAVSPTASDSAAELSPAPLRERERSLPEFPELSNLDEAEASAQPEAFVAEGALLEQLVGGDEDEDAAIAQPAEWFLGIDLGTTGLSAVLINRLGDQVYPLGWQMAGDDRDDRFRLPAVVQVISSEEATFTKGDIGPAALQQEAPLLRQIKPLVKIGIPHEETGEPLIQWSDRGALPLLTVQSALVDFLKTLSVDSLSCYATDLKARTLRTALADLQGVVVGYPNNWPDTYSFNVREAVLAAGIVSRPDQVMFVEEAIAALLSVLPNPQQAQGLDDQQSGLYSCSWSGETVVISAGATLTESAIAQLPTDLDQLSYSDFALRSFAYGGDSIDQDIVCQLLHQPMQGERGESNAATESGVETWQSLGLHQLTLPQAGEVDRLRRHRLRQRLNNSTLGQAVLTAARQVKLALQSNEQFELSLGGHHWTVERRDLESKILLPYVQRINRQVSNLLGQNGLSDQAVKQVVCTGGSASLQVIARWLRQKFPNATIVQDTYSDEYPNSCSRVAYGLANLCHYPQVLDANRHQYNDYFLLAELLRILPDQPLPAGGILHLLAQRGIDTQRCQSHILALIEGHLPPGLVPSEGDRPLISAQSSETATYQMLAELPLFKKQGGQIYIADPQQGVRLRTHLESLLAPKAQTLEAPLAVELARV